MVWNMLGRLNDGLKFLFECRLIPKEKSLKEIYNIESYSYYYIGTTTVASPGEQQGL